MAGGGVVVSGARGISVGCARVVSFTGCDVIIITITAAHTDGSHGCLATLKCHYQEDLCSLIPSVGVRAYSLRCLCIDILSLALSLPPQAAFITVWGFISGYWVILIGDIHMVLIGLLLCIYFWTDNPERGLASK